MKNLRSGRKPKAILKIGIDAGSLSTSAREKSGVSTLTYNLLQHLLKFNKRNQYYIYGFAPLIKDLLVLSKNIHYFQLPKLGFSKIWLPLKLKQNPPDVFLATSQMQPNKNISTVGFIYDVAFLQYGESYTNYSRLVTNTKYLVEHAKHIITISEASRDAIVNTYRISEKFITVSYPGVAKEFNPKGIKFVDMHPYFLFVGILKKTKNVPTLIEGFYEFLKTSSKLYNLILIGSIKDLDPNIPKTIEKYSLQKRVKIKGYVKFSDLPKYYRGAVGFVSPALVEGFGLPILEAMACGTPVVGGDNSSMPEIIGKSGIVVDVTNPNAIAKAFRTLAFDQTAHKKYRKLGLKQARMFTWKKFAKDVLEVVYKKVINDN